MEKISCSLIEDLLPLYCDGVCSEDSRRVIESHLKNCPKCSGLLQKMRTEYRLPDRAEPSEEEMVKGMASEWNRSVKRSFCKGVLVTVCTCLLLAGVYYSLTRLILIPVPLSAVESAVENVTGDNVEISLRVKDKKSVRSSSLNVTDDGKCFITLKRGVIPQSIGNQEAWDEEWSIARTRRTASGELIPIREIYFGTEESNFLIWQEPED